MNTQSLKSPGGAPMPGSQFQRRSAAFSLLELLAVMAIMSMMVMLVATNAGPMLKGTRLTQAAQILHDQMILARQLALSRNRAVEVRLLQYGKAGNPGENAADPASGKFRGIQLFLIEASGDAVPLGKFEELPSPIAMDTSSSLSPLIDLAQPAPASPALMPGSVLQAPLPDIDLQYNAVAFRFNPDGSTNLALGQNWFLTIHDGKGQSSPDKPPQNFCTIQVDPGNGRLRSFRP